MKHLKAIIALAILGCVPALAFGQDQFIGGSTPSVRPEGAPVMAEVVRDAAWYARALAGIEEPYPASLRFLEDQGRWFNPFLHPGMTGPYDIRHWHGDN